MARRSLSALMLLVLVLVGACGDGGGSSGGVRVSVEPGVVTLAPGGTQLFTATVVGAASDAVSWDASCGSVDGGGSSVTYTAPGVEGSCVVTVTSVEDPAAEASAVVSVVRPDGDGLVVLAYEVDVGLAEVRFVGPVEVGVAVSGVGEREVSLPAGSYVVSASVVEEPGEAAGAVSVLVPELSVESFGIVAGERLEMSLGYALGAVRRDTLVRLSDEDVASIVSVTADRLEFVDAPEAVVAMEVGDVLYLPPGVLPAEEMGVALGSASRAGDEPSCGLVDEGSYVVLLGGGSEGRRRWWDYVPASLADLYVQVVDVRAWCSFSGVLDVSLPRVGDFVSTQMRFDDVTVEVRLSGQEMFTNPLWPEEDLQWLAVQSAGCVVDPTSPLCRKWFVVTELKVDITAESLGPVVGLSPSRSESVTWSRKLFTIPFGPLPLRANVGLDLELALSAMLLELEYAGPLVVRYRYENQIGDGARGVGSGPEAFSWEPSFRILTPDLEGGGVFDASASVSLLPFVSVSDPARVAEVYVRTGAKGTVTVTVGDPHNAVDTHPFSVDAHWVIGVGYRDRANLERVLTPRGPTFAYTFEPPFYTFALSKLHFVNAVAVGDAFRLEFRRAGSSTWADPVARGHTYGLLVPGQSYEVRLTPLSDAVGVLASDCPGATSGAGISVQAPEPKQVCAVEVIVDDSGEPGGPITVSVEPASVTLPVNGTQSFMATVAGASDASVTWSATCGSISGSGNTVSFTAPGTAGACDVTATSVADSSKSATAVVTVTGGGTGFEPAPSYISIENVSLGAASGGTRQVGFDISWEESWRGPDRPTWVEASDNWDAAWVFVKYRVSGGAWQHATLAGSGHVVPSGAVVSVPSDRVGAFIFRSGSGYGTFTANGVGLQWDYVADGVAAGASVEVQPFGIEMVYVPQGSFSLGSGGSSTGEFRAGGTSNTPFVVSSQSSIGLGDASGQLMWSSTSSSGSPSGSTSASFPTGYGAFYVMKHQVTQGQYVDFLNTLTQAQASERKYTGWAFRYAITGSSVGSYTTSLPFVTLPFVTWADGAAYADWAGLRPMTELEFEKAARGPISPVANEYAWGSTSITQATGLANAGTITETPTPTSANAAYGNVTGVQGPVRVGAFAAPGRSRRDAGAGFYGALELSGNLWERTVTVGNAEGRAFAGTHGDGALDAGGNANVSSWPGTTAGGAGLRGGSLVYTASNLQVSGRFIAAGTAADRYNGWRGARSAP